jgi:6-phosphogluconolactonase (cycloisomerase 2 family)
LAAAFLLSCGSSSKKGFVYLASQGTQTVTAYSLNLGNGVLNSSNTGLVAIGKSAATGVQPFALILNPSQTVGFVADFGVGATATAPAQAGDISTFSIAKDGTVTALTKTSLKAPALHPFALAMDPSGKFLFVGSQGDAINASQCTTQDPAYPANCAVRISVFTIDANGGLSEATGSPFPLLTPSQAFTFSSPISVTGLAVSNQGNFLYVTEPNNNIVIGFSFDTSSGALTQLASTPVVVGVAPSAVASPAIGNFLYVANSTSNNISAFQVDSNTGILTAVPGSPFATGVSPISFATLSASNLNYVYTVDSQSNQVSGFSLNAVTGALKPLNPPAISTGSIPVAATIRSNGQVAGNFWMIVSNNGGNAVSTYELTTVSGALTALPQLVAPVAPYGIASK